MSFPTSQELSAFGEHLFWSAMTSQLQDQLPPASEVRVDGRKMLVTLPNGVKIAAGPVSTRPFCWMIAYGDHVVALPLETSRDDIARFILGIAPALAEQRGVPSPYRWGQLEHSPILDVADVLAAHGLELRAVVGSNPLSMAGSEVVRNDKSDGQFLDASDWDQLEIRLRWHPGYGWVADASADENDGPRGNRVDLAAVLGEHVNALPCAVPEDVDRVRLAEAVERLCRSDGHHVVTIGGFEDRYPGRGPETARWLESLLRWLGLRDVRCRDSGRSIEAVAENAYVRVRPKAVSLADVERLAGTAVNPQMTRVIVAHDWPTRGAVTAAERLGVALFSVSEHDHLPCRAHSSLAHVLLPHGRPWYPEPVDEPDDFELWVND